MYPAPDHISIPDEVRKFWADTDQLGMIGDESGWYVTHAWAERFRNHLAAMLPLAESGNPWAQYSVACTYMFGYLHATEVGAIANHGADALQGSRWLERCARQGMVAAVDNLVTMGVGAEADRLRAIFREIRSSARISCSERGNPIYPPHIIEQVWQRAYGEAV